MLSFLHKKVSWCADLVGIFLCDYVIEKQADQSLSNVRGWTYFCSIVNLQPTMQDNIVKTKNGFFIFLK